MEIVCNSITLRRFRTIKDFNLDLGIAKSSEIKKEGSRGIGQISINIKDPFMFKYNKEKNRFITKTGSIGTLGFYIDNSIIGNKYYIYDGNKEYEINYVENDDVREYLSNVIDKVLNGLIDPNIMNVNMEDKIEYKLDKNLPKDKFIDEYNKINKQLGKI